MMLPELILRAETLRRSTMGSITGEIFWRIAGEAFPGQGWWDFPVVIVGWWAATLIGDPAYDADLLFMDGPYFMRVIPTGRTDVQIECGRRSDAEVIERAAIVPLASIATEVVRVGRELLRLCEARSWDSSDVRALRTFVDQLSRTRAYDLHNAIRLRDHVRSMTKTELIQSMPPTMTASEIVAEAKKRGVKLSSQLVYVVRGSKLKKGKRWRPKKSAARPGDPRKASATPKARGAAPRSRALTHAEKQLAMLILNEGLGPVEAVLERLQKALR